MAQQVLKGSDRFRIEREIKDTLQGHIYISIDLTTGQPCVIKEARKKLVHSKRSRENSTIHEDFLYERQMIIDLSRLSNPPTGIIRGLDSWEDETCYYYAMDYCSGELFEFIAEYHQSPNHREYLKMESQKEQEQIKRPTEWIKIVSKIFKQIIQSMEWMHNNKVCHLDMSLENILISNELNIKIIDFGLAQTFNGNNFKTQGRIGKLSYMAPEVYSMQMYDARAADIYSAGIILFKMLIGGNPYENPSRLDPAFRYIFDGRIMDLLKHWKRLRLVTVDALDLLAKIIKPEDQRISLKDIMNHPFITNIEVENNLIHIDDVNSDQKNDDSDIEEDLLQDETQMIDDKYIHDDNNVDEERQNCVVRDISSMSMDNQ